MNDDVQKYVFGAILAFLVVVGGFVFFLFLNACDFTFTCRRGDHLVNRTPVPTLIPATMPAATQSGEAGQVPTSDQCRVSAVNFVGAWVNAGASDKEAFQFTDVNGQTCESSFEEVQPLFVQSNYWYSGSLACASCHAADVTISPAQLDLSSYEGILAGSRRESADVKKGTDILGKGNWTSSLLYQYVSANQTDIPGHNALMTDVLIYVGRPLAPTATETPTATAVVPTPTP
ncbi:MAG: hypothetical protein IT310_06575 [Anaerolineales bacterium]|nr:hypothetical protein [Anaerolineales bacterium]